MKDKRSEMFTALRNCLTPEHVIHGLASLNMVEAKILIFSDWKYILKTKNKTLVLPHRWFGKCCCEDSGFPAQSRGVVNTIRAGLPPLVPHCSAWPAASSGLSFPEVSRPGTGLRTGSSPLTHASTSALTSTQLPSLVSPTACVSCTPVPFLWLLCHQQSPGPCCHKDAVMDAVANPHPTDSAPSSTLPAEGGFINELFI